MGWEALQKPERSALILTSSNCRGFATRRNERPLTGIALGNSYGTLGSTKERLIWVVLDYAQAGLADVKGLRLIGTARQKASVMSLVIDGHANEAVARHLDAHGIAVRSGHHCALPAQRRFGVDQSVRASLAFYNTSADVDAFLKALHSLPR
jgi:selenocysteine lyase/cysteine desulfurase